MRLVLLVRSSILLLLRLRILEWEGDRGMEMLRMVISDMGSLVN